MELEGSAESQKPLNLPQKRKALPDPEKFTRDRREFKQWHFEISHKLEADQDTLGPEKTQFNYVYSRLGGADQNMAVPFAEKAAQTGLYNTNDLLKLPKGILYGPRRQPKSLKTSP